MLAAHVGRPAFVRHFPTGTTMVELRQASKELAAEAKAKIEEARGRVDVPLETRLKGIEDTQADILTRLEHLETVAVASPSFEEMAASIT